MYGTKEKVPERNKKSQQRDKQIIFSDQPGDRKKYGHTKQGDECNFSYFIYIQVAVVFCTAIEAKEQYEQ
jgi:hypothetical protein